MRQIRMLVRGLLVVSVASALAHSGKQLLGPRPQESVGDCTTFSVPYRLKLWRSMMCSTFALFRRTPGKVRKSSMRAELISILRDESAAACRRSPARPGGYGTRRDASKPG